MTESPKPATKWQQLAADLRPPAWALVVLGLVMSVGFPLYSALSPRERYILHLSDDAFYYLGVAPNIAAGRGPTADGITPTTGWHPLYGFLLAGLYRLTGPSLDGFVRQAMALNGVLYIAAAGLLFLAARQLWGRRAGWIAALLWLANPFAVLIARQGLESALYALCLSSLLWRIAAVAARNHTGGSYLLVCGGAGLCAGLTVLSRTDAILLMPLAALILLKPGARATPPQTSVPLGARLAGVGLFALLVAAAYGAWLLYVWHHTGEFHQGSAAVKMEWRSFMVGRMTWFGAAAFTFGMWFEYVIGNLLKVPALKWVLSGLPLLWPAGRALQAGRRWLLHLLWLTPLILGAAYSLMLDWVRAWYYMPGLVTLTLLSAGAAVAIAPGAGGPAVPRPLGVRHERLLALVRRTAGLIGWAVVIESAAVFGRGFYKEMDPDSEKLHALSAAEWLLKHVEPGTRIGCWHSGIVGYYTPGLDVINLDGLNNNEILPVVRGRKSLNQYWDERNITVIIGSPREKMGVYQETWDGKRLEPWGLPPRVDGRITEMSIEEQYIRQKVVRRIVPTTQTQPAGR